jgi:hypothetical protein
MHARSDFAAVSDETAVFELEALYSGNMYFMCAAHVEQTNLAGSKGWYLSMTETGKLVGNGAKDELSQWRILEEVKKPVRPPTPPSLEEEEEQETQRQKNHVGAAAETNSTSSSAVESGFDTHTPRHAPSTTAAAAGVAALSDSQTNDVFPGFGAGKEALLRFFATSNPHGALFLRQPEYAAALLLFKKGVLGKILHR